jgi:hypothetical protein
MNWSDTGDDAPTDFSSLITLSSAIGLYRGQAD